MDKLDAEKIKAIMSLNGNGLKNLIYISLNNGKVMYVTEDMKANNEIEIPCADNENFIKVINNHFIANGIGNFKERKVIEYHAVEFVETLIFATEDDGLIKKDESSEEVRNFNIGDIVDRSNKQSLRITHPNLEVVSGGKLTNDYEITAESTSVQIKLSGINKEFDVEELPHNMYCLPFDSSSLEVANNSPVFDINILKPGTHEILVHIGSQELYFKLIADDSIASSAAESVLLLSDGDQLTTLDDEEIVVKDELSSMSLDGTVISISEVSDSAQSKTLAVGNSLTVSVQPEQELTIVSTNTERVIVEGNLITRISEGQATVTITAEDGTVRSITIK